MKKFIVIGLGNFGLNCARELIKYDCEVLGIDKSRDVVQHADEIITRAIIADATDREVLESLACDTFDGVIVSTGQEMAKSILISFHLKELNAKRIICRAISDDHGEILKKVGVSTVVFPEKDMAIRIGTSLVLNNALDYLPLARDHGIIEVMPPDIFIGRTLRELELTKNFNCQILALKEKKDREETFKTAPLADETLTHDTIMVIFGKYQDIKRIQSL